MMPTLVPVVCAIGAQSGCQCFAINKVIVVAQTSACHLNGGRLAHHMNHIERTLGLMMVAAEKVLNLKNKKKS